MSFILYYGFHVYIGVWVLHICLGVHGYTCAWRPKADTECLPLYSLLHSLTLGFCWSQRLPAPNSLNSQVFCLCIFSAGIQACPCFIWVLHFELLSSWLFSKCIIHWVISSGWKLTQRFFQHWEFYPHVAQLMDLSFFYLNTKRSISPILNYQPIKYFK